MKNKTEKPKATVKTSPEQSNTGKIPPIDFDRRRANRSLDTQNLLALLKSEAPRFFELAEVVGRWVWIQFSEKQPNEVTRILAELGFHWNRQRQAWQHPCRLVTKGATYDPRARYGSYFAADTKPA